MRQVGNGTVAILKVKSIKKLLRFLLRNLAQRLLHRERRARILGHGIGLNLWFDAVHCVDLDRRGLAGGSIQGRFWAFYVRHGNSNLTCRVSDSQSRVTPHKF